MIDSVSVGRFCKWGSGGSHYPPDFGFTMARDAKGKPCGTICPECRERRHNAQVLAKKAKA